jgi:DNA primase
MRTRVDFKVVKEAARFEAILERYGLSFETKGKELLVRCPFHDDEKPSLRVNVEKKVFKCFACDVGGDVIAFVARKEDVSLREAAVLLAEWFGGGETNAPTPRARKGKENEEPTPATSTTAPAENKPLSFALKLEADHPYLASRGVDVGLASFFGLGFCSRGMMKGRIAIPIHNAKGELVAYLGRFAGEPPEGEERYKLPQGFHKSEVLFNLHRVAGAEHLVVVEGVWSVFRLHALAIPAVALLGRSLSPSQLRLLVESGVRNVTLLLDGDEAGRTAAAELLPRLASHCFVRVVNLPNAGEPDTLAEEELKKLLA